MKKQEFQPDHPGTNDKRIFELANLELAISDFMAVDFTGLSEAARVSIQQIANLILGQAAGRGETGIVKLSAAFSQLSSVVTEVSGSLPADAQIVVATDLPAGDPGKLYQYKENFEIGLLTRSKLSGNSELWLRVNVQGDDLEFFQPRSNMLADMPTPNPSTDDKKGLLYDTVSNGYILGAFGDISSEFQQDSIRAQLGSQSYPVSVDPDLLPENGLLIPTEVDPLLSFDDTVFQHSGGVTTFLQDGRYDYNTTLQFEYVGGGGGDTAVPIAIYFERDSTGGAVNGMRAMPSPRELLDHLPLKARKILKKSGRIERLLTAEKERVLRIKQEQSPGVQQVLYDLIGVTAVARIDNINIGVNFSQSYIFELLQIPDNTASIRVVAEDDDVFIRGGSLSYVEYTSHQASVLLSSFNVIQGQINAVSLVNVGSNVHQLGIPTPASLIPGISYLVSTDAEVIPGTTTIRYNDNPTTYPTTGSSRLLADERAFLSYNGSAFELLPLSHWAYDGSKLNSNFSAIVVLSSGSSAAVEFSPEFTRKWSIVTANIAGRDLGIFDIINGKYRFFIRADSDFLGFNTVSPTQVVDVNGRVRMRTQTSLSDGDDIVATKGYVDGGVMSIISMLADLGIDIRSTPTFEVLSRAAAAAVVEAKKEIADLEKIGYKEPIDAAKAALSSAVQYADFFSNKTKKNGE